MPRYYFDTDDDDMLVIDDDGAELPDDDAAWRCAQNTLPDMARDKMPDGDGRTFTVAVRDEMGDVIYRATLSLKGEWVKRTAP